MEVTLQKKLGVVPIAFHACLEQIEGSRTHLIEQRILSLSNLSTPLDSSNYPTDTVCQTSPHKLWPQGIVFTVSSSTSTMSSLACREFTTNFELSLFQVHCFRSTNAIVGIVLAQDHRIPM